MPTDTTYDMTDDEVDALLASAKTKGQYGEILRSFLASGKRGQRFPLDSGRFQGKAAASVKQGFLTAVKAAGDDAASIRVLSPKDAGFVALVNANASAE